MVVPSDFERIAVTRPMLRAAVAYATRSLHYTYDRMGLDPYSRLSKIFFGIVMQHAFLAWLNRQGVPYDRRGETHFTQTDRYDVRVDDRPCDVKGTVLEAAGKVWAVRRDPGWLLDCAALMPVDQHERAHPQPGEAYVFPFLLVAPKANTGDRYWLQVFGDRWKPDAARGPLGHLELDWRGTRAIEVEIGGMDAGGGFLSEQVCLEPEKRIRTEAVFDGLLYLHVEHLPGADLGLTTVDRRFGATARARGWRDYWIEEGQVILTGWMDKLEFVREATRLPRGSAVKQYARTKTDNYYRPIRELEPLRDMVAPLRA